MSRLDDELFETADEVGYVPYLKNLPRARKQTRAPKVRRERPTTPVEDAAALQENSLEMTYHASRYEALWLLDSLSTLFQQKWFDDVLRMIKGGKEASVYLCQGNETTGEDFLAAKVYRPRRFRNLRNDGLYREGRRDLDAAGHEITNSGMLHAMRKRTEFGRELLHTSWLEHEFQTLRALHAAGADVPRPFASDSNTILMGYYGDDVMGAPTLNDVSLATGEARALFERVIHNIDLMLAQGRIHGDLSAYNILYWEGDIVLIDFPQVIHPDQNRSAYRIFERDVLRVCEYFRRMGVPSNPRKIAADLWAKHNHRFIPLVDPKVLAEDSEDERDIWESLKNAARG